MNLSLNFRNLLTGLACAAAFLIVSGPSAARAFQPLLFESELAALLVERDSFFDSLPLPSSVRFTGITNPAEQIQLESRLSEIPDSGSIWHSLLSGVTHVRSTPALADSFFAVTLGRASASAAASWILFNEFERFGARSWSRQALDYVRMHLGGAGVEKNRIIAQHLLFLATQSRGEQAIEYCNLARSFDPNSPWPLVRTFFAALPGAPSQATAALGDWTRLLLQSWHLQLDTLDYLLALAFSIILLSALAVVATLMVKYCARIFHPLLELFPAVVPGPVRLVLAGILLLSLVLPGVLFAIWACAFLLWGRTRRQEKMLLGVVLLLVTILPLLGLVHSSVRDLRGSHAPLQIVHRSMHEGASPQLLDQVKASLKNHGDNPQTHTAAAIALFKAQSYDRAANHIYTARSMRPADPVILQMEGVIAAASGQPGMADWALRQAIELDSRNPAALFNLGSFLMSQLKTPEGAELIKRAREYDRIKIDHYVDRNDRFYSDNIPFTRQYLIPDYTPKQFWSNLFVIEWHRWDRVAPFWGNRFLGFSAFTSLWIFAVLYVLLVAFFAVPANRTFSVRSILFWIPPTRQFTRTTQCEICGAAMCSRCGRGHYCRKCSKKLRTAGTESRLTDIKRVISQHSLRRRILSSALADTLFPGCGMLYSGRAIWETALCLVFSAMLASVLLGSVLWTADYPVWATKGLLRPLWGLIGVYVLAFIVNGFNACMRAGIFKEE